jgi:choline dehydrogenase-like flavoprotein
MLRIWRRVVIGSALAVYVVGLGCAGGMLAERLRSEEPYRVLGRYALELRQWHRFLMPGELAKGARAAVEETRR